MSTDRDAPASQKSERDSRRWLIGVGISLIFGIFSMVMAVLSYSPKTDSTARPARNDPAARGGAAEPIRHGRPRGNRGN
jgi:hypothetical protein